MQLSIEADRVRDYRQTAAIFSNTLEPANLSSYASVLETSRREAVLKFNSLLPHQYNCKKFIGAYIKKYRLNNFSRFHVLSWLASAWSVPDASSTWPVRGAETKIESPQELILFKQVDCACNNALCTIQCVILITQ